MVYASLTGPKSEGHSAESSNPALTKRREKKSWYAERARYSGIIMSKTDHVRMKSSLWVIGVDDELKKD